MRTTLFRCLAPILIVTSTASLADATMVTYSFTGTVTEITEVGTPVLADSGIVVGSEMLGTLSWDEDATTCFNSDCTAFYNLEAPLASFTLTYGSFWVQSGNVQVLYTGPSSWRFDWPGDITGTTGFEYVLLDIGSATGETLPIGGSPLKSFDPSIFDSGTLHAGGSYAYDSDFRASISNVQAVPEPAAWMLFALGLVGSAWTFRKARPQPMHEKQSLGG